MKVYMVDVNLLANIRRCNKRNRACRVSPELPGHTGDNYDIKLQSPKEMKFLESAPSIVAEDFKAPRRRCVDMWYGIHSSQRISYECVYKRAQIERRL